MIILHSHIFLSFLGSPLKHCMLFKIVLQFSLPRPYTKLKPEKIMDTRVQHCLWGEGRGWTCVNLKTPQKRESVPRLLSMTVGSEFKTYCGCCYKFLGRPWLAMKEYQFLKSIFRQFHAMKRLKLKKLGEKRRRREKDPIQLYAHVVVNPIML